MQTETIIFDGCRYTRYPDSAQKSKRNYYGCRAAKGSIYLHRAIWEKANGPIPKGWNIHHTDGNPLNNDLANLECLTVTQHRRRHRECSDKMRHHLANIRPEASKWHRSQTGKAWHSKQSQKNWRQRMSISKKCIICGDRFDCITHRDNNRFCSRKCGSANRRKSGVDKETRSCAWCGATFLVEKSAKTKNCCRSHGKLNRDAQVRACLQSAR